MVDPARRATPDDNGAALQGNAAGPGGKAEAAKQECPRQAERNRDDRRRQIALVFVAMQRQPGSGLVPVDQASVRLEPDEACGVGSIPGQPPKRYWDWRPAAAGHRARRLLAVPSATRHPAS